jgi:hypothetical protein
MMGIGRLRSGVIVIAVEIPLADHKKAWPSKITLNLTTTCYHITKWYIRVCELDDLLGEYCISVARQITSVKLRRDICT